MRILPTIRTISALAAACWFGSAHAGDYDGSKPFLCALLDLNSCEVDAGCQAETPDSVDIPRFLFVDAKQGTISGTRPGGKLLATRIERTRTLGNLLVLEGAEAALSWTVTVEQTSGRMSLSAAGDGVGFVVFGACIGAQPD
jgi:hypothetical protein